VGSTLPIDLPRRDVRSEAVSSGDDTAVADRAMNGDGAPDVEQDLLTKWKIVWQRTPDAVRSQID